MSDMQDEYARQTGPIAAGSVENLGGEQMPQSAQSSLSRALRPQLKRIISCW